MKPLADEVNTLASQCVKCALCLPHCPTYVLTEDENESPRGRIALFQALSQQQLPLTEKAKHHLDQCLGCRACERVCPAHVEYGELLVTGRELLTQIPSQTPLAKPLWTTRLLSWLATKPALLRGLHGFLWGAETLKLRSLARALKLTSLFGLTPLDNLLPPVAKPIHFQFQYEAIGAMRGKVMLFQGCIASLCDQQTLAATIFVLRHFGYQVVIPPEQNCCGAIALHAGKFDQAYQLAQQNIAAFVHQHTNIDYVITSATGCHAVLQEYARHFSSQSNSKKEALTLFSSKVMDIMTFILQCEWPETRKPQALDLQVMLHTPCTRRNVLKAPPYAEQLFARIPKLTWHSFASPDCCGAAGTYMLDHPDLAQPLAQRLLSELQDIQVDFIATTNVGCALHLMTQLKNLYPNIKVGHPVTLLARSLGF